MNHSSTAPQDRPSKRDDILAAALQLFSERGFHGTAVPLVAQAAHVGAGTIYRYFESKQSLVNALYRQCKEHILAFMLAGFPFDAAPREQFREFWRRLAAFAHGHPHAFSFLELHYHAPYLDAESLRLEQTALELAGSFIRQTQRAGITRNAHPEALIALVWGAFVGLVKAEKAGHLRLDDDIIRQTAESCWDALRAANGSPEDRPSPAREETT
ncbi:MAG: TetR/AcrR family transcriptional regulator [Candidatus Schekmanbacteria bacterium]|nr:TetR/AcrR family transcriptional regulator [Candidatus Schekmanbacteria bacterium]